MPKPIIICADIIARSGKRFVLVERLEMENGLALPCGKQESNEQLSATANREFREETGLVLKIENVLGTYAEKNRDPRGRYISTVFIGSATGVPKDEPGKTHVLLLSQKEIIDRKDQFLFDHFEILMDYFKHAPNLLNKKGGAVMAVRVINVKPDRSVVKQAICRSCGATLEYVPNDVLERHGTDCGGGPDGCEWIVCPNCRKNVTLRSW